ncbi:MAG: DsbA family protein [Candidatus Komeilibacteria bacterium]|nr:DsbA family protein [Candidatus Komeilibacteria bacterium]
MFDEQKGSFFAGLNPKTTFIFGLVAGVLLLCTVGFFILLTGVISGKEGSSSAKGNNQAVVLENDNVAPAPSAENPVNIELSGDEYFRGDKDAKVKIVEFSDFQCPFCSRFHPTMQQVMSEYGDQVAWIYKHFPLDSLHPQARPAAEASECVGEQKGNDGFWKFTDGIYANQQTMGTALYEQLAQEAGANLNKFKECVSSRKYQQKVEADYQEGLSYGVDGTPGSFVNGVPVRGALPFESVKSIIDSQL